MLFPALNSFITNAYYENNHLREQPAGSEAKSAVLIRPLSVFPLTMGEMGKQDPSVGTKAVVMGFGLAGSLQPAPE